MLRDWNTCRGVLAAGTHGSILKRKKGCEIQRDNGLQPFVGAEVPNPVLQADAAKLLLSCALIDLLAEAWQVNQSSSLRRGLTCS
jgi:hypothetical protein